MEEELEKHLLIDVARLDSEGETLEGEVDIIDLEEEFVHPFGGVRYRLKVQAFGTELVVQGHLEQDFDLTCSRCDQDFDTTIKVDDFCVASAFKVKDTVIVPAVLIVSNECSLRVCRKCGLSCS